MKSKVVKAWAAGLAALMLVFGSVDMIANAAANVGCTHSWTVDVKNREEVISRGTHTVTDDEGLRRTCTYEEYKTYYDIICRSCGMNRGERVETNTRHSVSHH